MTEKVDAGLLNDENVAIPEGVPQPMLWRILVAPVKPKCESRGGIIIPDQARDAEETLTFLGKVIACGPLVGAKPEWPKGAYNVQPGDWVIFGRYAGQMFEFKGVKMRLIDDDAIMAKASGPEGFRVYI